MAIPLQPMINRRGLVFSFYKRRMGFLRRWLILLTLLSLSRQPLVAKDSNGSYGYIQMLCPMGVDRQWDAGESSVEESFPPNPDEARCTRTFVAGRESTKTFEEYKLSFYDPIEVFSWDMPYSNC